MWKKVLHILLWILTAGGTGILLIAAMQKKEEKACPEVKIAIKGAYDHVFVDSKDVMDILKDNGATPGKKMNSIELEKIEQHLEKNPWIKKAELFFDTKQVLHAHIEEREPIARIFAHRGKSFYIDSNCNILPLSDKLSARVPMFTSFPAEKVLSASDSVVMQDVRKIALYLQNDSFWMQQAGQIDIVQEKNYEIIPVIGNQVIRLGDAENLEKKFAKLMAFYKQVWSKTGFEKYETIDLRYDGQVVATRRTAKSTTDSYKPVQELVNPLTQTKSTDEDVVMNEEPETKMVAAVERNESSVKEDENSRQPKAIMKKRN